VNELHNELMTTFSEYRVPPSFFGPLQVVNYDGLGGTYEDNADDAEFNINLNGKDLQAIDKKA